MLGQGIPKTGTETARSTQHIGVLIIDHKNALNREYCREQLESTRSPMSRQIGEFQSDARSTLTPDRQIDDARSAPEHLRLARQTDPEFGNLIASCFQMGPKRQSCAGGMFLQN